MGFAAIARVTEHRWIACSVRDDIAFGLHPGSELDVKTTICDEIRGHRQPVVIDDVSRDEQYRDHHTPARYGFKATSRCRSSCPAASSSAPCAPSIHGRRGSTPPKSSASSGCSPSSLPFTSTPIGGWPSAKLHCSIERETARLARTVHRRARPRPAQPARQHFERGPRARQDAATRPGDEDGRCHAQERAPHGGPHRRRARLRARPAGRRHHADVDRRRGAGADARAGGRRAAHEFSGPRHRNGLRRRTA